MSWRVLQSDSVKRSTRWALAAASGGWFLHHWHANGSPNDDGTAITHAEASSRSARPAKVPVVFPASNTTKLSPLIPIRVIRPNPDLEIAFDVRTRNAIYVLEKLDRGGQNLGKDHKRPNFYEEHAIDQESYRSRLTHYKNSGFDRGHLAPAADFPTKTEDTYNLCNISPQNHNMNMSIWSKIEDFTRRVADRAKSNGGGETYVVTGPLWLPAKQVAAAKFEYSYLGLGQPPSLVAVPTHFFKIVAVVAKGNIVEFACFVVPNVEPNKSKGMHDYIVPWTDLEAVTGLQFFPTLATEEWKDWADYITQETVLRFRTSRTPKEQLLLTDGGKKSSSKSNASSRNNNSAMLVHLCKGGECR